MPFWFSYLRLHGSGSWETSYGYKYTTEDLNTLREHVLGLTVFVFFNPSRARNVARFRAVMGY
jgi:uncharacterized protein YecE (DUF72 family)